MKTAKIAILLWALGVSAAFTDEPPAATSATPLTQAADLWKNTAGQWFSPHLHVTGAAGVSSGEPTALAAGHHDPSREGGSIQGIEVGGSLRIDPYLEGFATYNLSWGADKEWSDEWEEAFLKLRCPAEYGEVRGGRMLARFGQHNTRHLHAWNTVDMPLVLGRFLGDDGLIVDGGDATGFLPAGDTLLFGAVFGYGYRPDFHGAHSDEEGHDHQHSGLANDAIYTGRLFARYTPTDFFDYTLGLSAISGEYGSDSLDSSVLGADFSIDWRENGLEPGGQRINWTTEVLHRRFDAEEMHEEHEDHSDHADHEEHHAHEDAHHVPNFNESGFYTALLYAPNEHFDTQIRLGWVEGVEENALDERWRISPSATWWVTPGRTLYARLQYNCDVIADNTDEHSVWLQLGLSLGQGEVR